ncbi:hypothetical protein F9802_01485 [Bacillus aerolatus]|uniref:YqzH-like protein n=1 Tax=Bacillus aerolatus TaxID=2653354 RepID=A0A6I1FJM0_9BACI|nr:YqzH family protein [Bacillus aerolatus]KAB7708845.1 hypothetical protein F9802_01485 [Bacillus aerolatus]
MYKKMIKHCLMQYDFEAEGQEAENIYKEIIHRVQKRQAADDGELYELIEDEVYEFITSA